MLDGALSDLAARLNALEAKQRMASGTTSTSTATSSSSSSSTTGNWTEVNPYVTLISSGAGVAWTTVSVSSYVPAGTTWVRLNGYGRNHVTDNQDAELQFRKNSSSVDRLAMKNRSVAGSYTGEAAFIIEVPLTESLSFDYQITTNGWSDFSMRLIEYR